MRSKAIRLRCRVPERRSGTIDQTCFEAVCSTIASLTSRRDVLRGLAGAGIGVGALIDSAFGELDVDAKKKWHKTKK